MAVSKETRAVEGRVPGQSNEPLSLPAHCLPSARVAQELQTEMAAGLSSEEAAGRLDKFGANDLGKEKGVRPLEILAAQVVNAMTLVSPSSCASVCTQPC